MGGSEAAEEFVEAARKEVRAESRATVSAEASVEAAEGEVAEGEVAEGEAAEVEAVKRVKVAEAAAVLGVVKVVEGKVRAGSGEQRGGE
mgnify:CR=1 FL=1